MLKITELQNPYSKDTFLNIFSKYQNQLNIDFNNVFTTEKIQDFVNTQIINKILYTLISETNIYENNYIDFILSKELFQYINSIPYKFFKEDISNYFDSNSLIINVDEDFDCYDKFTKDTFNFKEKNHLFLFPTLPSFLDFSNSLEETFNLPSDSYKSKTLYDLYGEYEELENKILSENNISPVYQYGGNCLIDIQLSNTDIIGFYYGGYGDAGALYVNFKDNNFYSFVDMH